MWTHPRDHSSDYTSLDHWVRLARMLERGLFDGLFLAGVLGVCDVYRGNADASLRAGVQIPLLDPMALVPAMASSWRADPAPRSDGVGPRHGLCDHASRFRRDL
jgi:long-chain alkane monooxygenase